MHSINILLISGCYATRVLKCSEYQLSCLYVKYLLVLALKACLHISISSSWTTPTKGILVLNTTPIVRPFAFMSGNIF